MYSIRRFGVIKTATIVALMYVIVVAIVIVPLAVLVAIGGTAFRGDVAAGGAGFIGVSIFGLFAALAYGAIGWVFTALACVLYNVAAGWVGGIELQLDVVAPAAPTPVWSPTLEPPASTPPASTPPTD
jgi:hypothetical protein